MAASTEYKKLGGEFHHQMFSGTGVNAKSAESMFKVGEIFSRTNKPFKVASSDGKKTTKLLKDVFLLFQNTLATTRADAGADIIKSLGGSNDALAKYMAAGGLEDTIALLPKQLQPKARSYWNDALTIAFGDSTAGLRNQAIPAAVRTRARSGVVGGISNAISPDPQQ